MSCAEKTVLVCQRDTGETLMELKPDAHWAIVHRPACDGPDYTEIYQIIPEFLAEPIDCLVEDVVIKFQE